MKRLHRLKTAACAALLSLIALTPGFAAVIVGSGLHASYLVIEAPEFGSPLIYEYRYTFNSSAPLDTYAMLAAVDGADANLSFEFINYGTSESPNFFLDSITFDSITLFSDDPFWAQWVSGGKSGFPSATPIASGEWLEGAGLSLAYRELAPGSWDGFIHNGEYNPDPPYELLSLPPSVTPVPEPATLVLILCAGGALLLHGRRKKS